MADPAPFADPRWARVAPGRSAENVGQRGLADPPLAGQFAQEMRKPKLGNEDFDTRKCDSWWGKSEIVSAHAVFFKHDDAGW